MAFIDHTLIKIHERIRGKLLPENLGEVTKSIERVGLMHPIVLRREGDDFYLVAGETRLTAMRTIWSMGGSFKFGEEMVASGQAPYTDFGELPPDIALEMEIDENARRSDIDWQKRVDAVARLHAMRKAKDPSWSLMKTANELGVSHTTVAREMQIGQAIQERPHLAKAANVAQATRMLEIEVTREHAVKMGVQVPADEKLKLFVGDFKSYAGPMDFDIICTDPPYGVAADTLKARVAGQGHVYDDSEENAMELVDALFARLNNLTKASAHFYMFCAYRLFDVFRTKLGALDTWRVWPRPLIWTKNTGHAFDIAHGPVFHYETILYAIRGEKIVLKEGKSDVLPYVAVAEKRHQAEKPVGLLVDLLGRSGFDNARVFDPFVGSGSLFVAAHQLKMQAVGCEIDPLHAAVAAERIKELQK